MRPYGTLFSGAKATRSTCFIIFYLLSFILLKQIFRQNDVAFWDLGPIEGAGLGRGRCWGGGGLQAAGEGQLADDLLGGVFRTQVLETLVAVAL